MLTGGNTGLSPEVSDTKSFGIVLTPTFFDGFTATVDYFDIKVDGAISTVPDTISLNQCTQLTNTALCPLVHRDTNGFLFTDFGYVIATNVNTGYIATKGIDVEANYITDLNDMGMGENGSVAINFIGSYVDSSTAQPYTGASSVAGGKTYTDYDCVGLFAHQCLRHSHLRVAPQDARDLVVAVGFRCVGRMALHVERHVRRQRRQPVHACVV